MDESNDKVSFFKAGDLRNRIIHHPSNEIEKMKTIININT
jgi:hypothetical protein